MPLRKSAYSDRLTSGIVAKTLKIVTDCPCCALQARLFIVSKDHNRRVSQDEFYYYRCTDCGLVFIDPVPVGVERFYVGGYQPIPGTLGELREMAAPERFRLEPIIEKAGGDLLEIGPWIGVFSINAKDAGFKVDAIEMSCEASKFLREVVQISVVNTDDPVQALRAPKLYDVIALWHSLEHLPRPWAVLEAASKRLKPGGILLVAIPNIGSAQARLLGARWLHLDAPRHLYFWPPTDLSRLVKGFGLQTIKLDTDDRLSRILSLGAWHAYIRATVRIPLVRGAAARLLSPIAAAITQRPERGAGLTATFRAPVA
jgi:2-polyprenyl-3-methyl-5-hydroxy-6-metoxy-1,4-benzoquinol methylase